MAFNTNHRCIGSDLIKHAVGTTCFYYPSISQILNGDMKIGDKKHITVRLLYSYFRLLELRTQVLELTA